MQTRDGPQRRVLEDKHGNLSSKRYIALGAFFIAAAVAVLGIILKSDVATQLVWPFVALAGGEGFASALER